MRGLNRHVTNLGAVRRPPADHAERYPYDVMTRHGSLQCRFDEDYGARGTAQPIERMRSTSTSCAHGPSRRDRPHHSTYATIIAITRREIPACHYMIAAFGALPSAARPTRATARRAVRQRPGRARGSARLPARQPRHDRARRDLDKAMWQQSNWRPVRHTIIRCSSAA